MMTSQYKSDDRLIRILDEYSGSAKCGTVLNKIACSVETPDMIIPVLGMQGMGKSTLLNAVLSEDILPNDADETTCVPVEVRYAQKGYAEVFFLDKSKPAQLAKTKEDLEKYVDNVHNKGNEKSVSHIVLYRNLEILKRGLVLVDLPGVGSLTEENQRTTMRYIEDLYAAIFIIPTVPTIRKTDAAFIKNVWKALNSCIFVQNPFDDETDDTIQESVEYNLHVLQNIADEIHTPFDNRIIVVNAYAAICARLQKNQSLLVKSNLSELLKEFDDLGKNRAQILADDFSSKVSQNIKDITKRIETLIEEKHLSDAELAERLRKNEAAYRESTRRITNEVDGIRTFLSEKSRELRSAANSIGEYIEQSFRADINHVIDNGVVDGNRLSSAFSDHQKKYAGVAADKIYDIQQQFVWELEDKMRGLSEAISIDKETASGFSGVAIDAKLKFEKGLQVGIDVVGGVGGVVAGMKIGALIGGPVGAVIGTVAGIAISIVSGLIGSSTKKTIKAERAASAKLQIEPMVQEYAERISESIKSNYSSTIRKVDSYLDDYLLSRQEEQKEWLAQTEAQIRSENQNNYSESSLIDDLMYLRRYTSFGRELVEVGSV